MHLTLSIAGHGQHPAAARLSPLTSPASALPRYASLARQAQAALLDGIFFTSSKDALQPDATPLIGTLVAPTSGIGLGASVPIAHTEPFHTARAFAVLDGLSAGRTALLCDLRGGGQGDAGFEHRPLLSAEAHYERAEEYLAVATQLWDSWEDGAVVVNKPAGIFADSDKIHAIHHAGKHFRVRGPLTAVRPVQGHPVIVVDDMSAPGRKLAARFADVFIGDCASMEEARALAADLRAQRAALGLAPDALRILATVSPILAASDAAAREREARLDAACDGASAMPGHRFTGTPEALCDLVAAWHQAGACDGFNIAPAVLADDAGPLFERVIPLLQARGLFRGAYGATTLRGHLSLPRPPSSFSAKPAHG